MQRVLKTARVISILSILVVPTTQNGVDVKTALRSARSVTQLFSLLSPHDARLCDVGLLEQLETSTSSNVHQDGSYQKLVAACNHTTMNHDLREFPTLRGRSTISDKALSTKDVNAMNKLFKNAIPKTKCKIRSTLVTLPDPPNGFFYLPSCVSVKRCVGCCSDELTDCLPTATKLVKKQVIIIDVTSTNQPKLMKLKPIQIEEHLKCQCSCKLSPSDCSKVQRFDSDSCVCRCNNKTACNNGLSWDPMKCGCL